MQEEIVPPFQEIESQITRNRTIRDINPGTTINICILTKTQPNGLYQIGTLEEWTAKYYSGLDAGTLDQWASTIRSNYDDAKNINASVGVRYFTDAEKAIVKEQVIKLWGNVTNITFNFVEDPTTADIRIGINAVQAPGTLAKNVPVSINFVPGDGGVGYVGPKKPNDVFLEGFNAQRGLDARNINDLAHEFGHALGLSHPARGVQPNKTVDGNLDRKYDTLQWALMSYSNSAGGRLQSTTPMLMDAVGLKAMGFLRNDLNSGDTEHIVDVPNGAKTILDSGGTDTLAAKYKGADGIIRVSEQDAIIDLRATDFTAGKAYFSSIPTIGTNIDNVAIYEGTEIENATGGKGSDKLIGNDLPNVLDGGEGDDALEGGAGADTYNFKGAFGNDTVLDTDGLGTLKFDGVAMPLSPLKPVGSNKTWKDATGQFLFTKLLRDDGNEDLKIIKYQSAKNKTVQGMVTVRNFVPGMFGIDLTANAEMPPTQGLTKVSLVARKSSVEDPSVPADSSTPAIYESDTSLAYRNIGDESLWIYATESDGGQIVETGAGDDKIFVGRFYESGKFPGPENWGPGPGEDEDHVSSGAGNDVVATGYGSDVIDGGDGNDYLLSAMMGLYTQYTPGEIAVGTVNTVQNHDLADADSSDLVDGGAGNDWIRAGMGADVLLGGTGNDSVFGMEGNDVLSGGEGDDILYGDGMYTARAGGVHDEIIFGYSFKGDDTLLGDDGSDQLIGGIGEDQLYGGAGNDYLYGDSNGVSQAENLAWIPSEYHAADHLDGGDGNDFLLGGGGADVLVGSAGNDTLRGDVYDGINVELAYQGDDLLDGGEGDDFLVGDGGADTLLGGEGGDSLFGDAGADILVGGANFDVLDGGDGDDTYVFNPGDFDGGIENITDSAGADVIEFKSGISLNEMRVNRGEGGVVFQFADQGGVKVRGGIDVIEHVQFADGTILGREDLVALATKASDGDDWITTLVADSTVKGGLGNDLLEGWEWADHLFGGDGNDKLSGLGGNDELDGGAGDDELRGGGDGKVSMTGGSGRDFLYDFGSDTIYHFDRNSGLDYIEDAGGVDTVELGEGITPDDIVVRNTGGALQISTASSQLVFSKMVRGSAGQLYPQYSLENIRFAGGLQWDLPKILQQALLATDGDDVINGFDGAETIEGLAGDDKLFGNDGDDVLKGGAGNDRLEGGLGTNALEGGEGNDRLISDRSADTLIGGAGDDVYEFTDSVGDSVVLEAGFGHDRTEGFISSARVLLKEGISASTAMVTSSGEDVTVTFSANESITLAGVRYRSSGEFYRVLPTFSFADGTVWTDATIRSLIGVGAAQSTNHAPAVATPLPDTSTAKGKEWIYQVPGTAFTDADAGDALTYSATVVDGSPLPTWLSFDPATRTFRGTAPSNAPAGLMSLRVVATDTGGLSANASFTLAITADSGGASNNPPVAKQPLSDANVDEGTLWTYRLPVDAFADPDPGDSLVYTATLIDGSDLPSWIHFDVPTMTLSGTPNHAAIGQLSIRVRATDSQGAAVSTVFALTVASKPSGSGDQVLQADDNNTPLVGGNGNDTITGSWASSTLSGGAGNDRLIATGGPQNVLDGGEGDDEITGGWGNDRLIGGEGNNTIRANGSSSVITAGSGNDTITGNWGDDQIDAGHGNNRVDAAGGKNTVIAGDGDDTVTSGWGDDTIDAGNGNNTVDAGGGTNHITSGAGNDVVRADGTNTIATGAGNDHITTTWGADTIDAGAGDDLINAGGGNNTLRGGLGNDQFTSTDWSDDRYLFARGDGQDTISDGGGQDILILEDVRSDQLWFTQVGNDLSVNVLGTQDSILIKDWYGSGGNGSTQFHLEQIKTSDGKTLLDSQVHNLVQAMSAFAPPVAGQTTLPAGYQSALAPVLAANWQ